MLQKPITVARNDYMQSLCDLTNASHLPAFVVVDVLERFAREISRLAESELSRDRAAYQRLIEASQAGDVAKGEDAAVTTND